MENEVNVSSNIKNWIIIGVVALITFILVFVITNKLINGNKKNTPTTPTVEIEKYTAYKVGDIVTLKNGSNWHVLYESKETSEYLTLLNDDDVNSSGILYANVNSFLKGTYKTDLIKELGCQSSDIQEIRLLAYLDLADISKANSAEFLPDTELSKFNFPEWIYAKSTVTDTVYQTEESNSPVMICTTDFKDSSISKIPEDSTNIDSAITDATNNDTEKTENTNRFCLGDSTVSLPVRPVLVISKNLLKNTTTEDSTTNTNTTTNSDNTIGN